MRLGHIWTELMGLGGQGNPYYTFSPFKKERLISPAVPTDSFYFLGTETIIDLIHLKLNLGRYFARGCDYYYWRSRVGSGLRFPNGAERVFWEKCIASDTARAAYSWGSSDLPRMLLYRPLDLPTEAALEGCISNPKQFDRADDSNLRVAPTDNRKHPMTKPELCCVSWRLIKALLEFEPCFPDAGSPGYGIAFTSADSTPLNTLCIGLYSNSCLLTMKPLA